jgi:hypothetical protein
MGNFLAEPFNRPCFGNDKTEHNIIIIAMQWVEECAMLPFRYEQRHLKPNTTRWPKVLCDSLEDLPLPKHKTPCEATKWLGSAKYSRRNFLPIHLQDWTLKAASGSTTKYRRKAKDNVSSANDDRSWKYKSCQYIPEDNLSSMIYLSWNMDSLVPNGRKIVNSKQTIKYTNV